jgi:antitoxin Phd
MLIETQDMFSMTEANRNFSKVAKRVDETGSVVIVKNNKPRYVIVDWDALQPDTTTEAHPDRDEVASPEEIAAISARLIGAHMQAYQVLAQ